jgi:hypothetical protein
MKLSQLLYCQVVYVSDKHNMLMTWNNACTFKLYNIIGDELVNIDSFTNSNVDGIEHASTLAHEHMCMLDECSIHEWGRFL